LSSSSSSSSSMSTDGVVLASDPKPRLRWTAQLHQRFVDAVRQIGGANSKFLRFDSSHEAIPIHMHENQWIVSFQLGKP
jgi:SHAQKYF class myb-like DNA-binding protein